MAVTKSAAAPMIAPDEILKEEDSFME